MIIKRLGNIIRSLFRPAHQSVLQELKNMDSSITGGDGLSMETAIVLATANSDVVGQEYAIYRAIYGISPAGQRLLYDAGRHYDMLVNGDKELYFDITAYWEHTYGKE